MSENRMIASGVISGALSLAGFVSIFLMWHKRPVEIPRQN